MPSVTELLEQRNAVAERLMELRDKCGGEFTDAIDAENWDKLNEDFDGLTKRIDVETRMAEVQARLQTSEEDRQRIVRDTPPRHRETAERQHPSEEDRANALQGWMVYQAGQNLSQRQQAACDKLGIRPDAREFEVRLATGRGPRTQKDIDKLYGREYRDLSTGTSGVTLPTTMAERFERAMLFYNAMRPVADIFRTDHGRDFLWPSYADTGNTGEIISEGATTNLATSVDPTMQTVTLGAFKYSSKSILISFELLQDHPLDLASALGDMIGERIGRKQNLDFTTGAGGASVPRGFVTGAVAATSGTVDTATTDTFAADDVWTLLYGVDRAYRNQGASFMAHDNFIRDLRKFRSDSGAGAGTGDYLWQPSFQAGEPGFVGGFPIRANNDMDDTINATVDNYIMAFGQFSSYKIRDVVGLRLRRLEEIYADTDQIAFIGFFRSDGDYVNPGEAASGEANPIKLLNAT